MKRFNYILFTFSFLFYFIFFSCTTYRSQLEKEYFTQAEDLYKEKKYSEALSLFQKAQKVSFNNSANFRIIEIMILEGKLEEAREKLNFLLLGQPKNKLLRELEAFWYFKNGDIEIAKKKYEDLLSQDITSLGRIYTNLGIIYFAEKNISKSIDYFLKAIEIGEISEEIVKVYLEVLTYTEDVADNSGVDQQSNNQKEQVNVANVKDNVEQDDKISKEKTNTSVVEANVNEDVIVNAQDEGSADSVVNNTGNEIDSGTDDFVNNETANSEESVKDNVIVENKSDDVSLSNSDLEDKSKSETEVLEVIPANKASEESSYVDGGQNVITPKESNSVLDLPQLNEDSKLQDSDEIQNNENFDKPLELGGELISDNADDESGEVKNIEKEKDADIEQSLAPESDEKKDAGLLQADIEKNSAAKQNYVTDEEITLSLNKVLSVISEKYNDNKMSTAEVSNIAALLLDRQFFIHSFALYKIIAEGTVAEDYEKTKAYFFMAGMIIKKQYELTDEEPLASLLLYLEKGFENIKPSTRPELIDYKDMLLSVLDEETLSDVLKKRLINLYTENNLVLDEKKQSEEDDTSAIENNTGVENTTNR